MKDKNNIEMRTGDIVKVSGAYTKRHNGYFLIIHTPGDCCWLGSDYCLKRLKRNGELSKGSYTTQFWPLTYFSNNRNHNAAAREHDEKNATIEVVTNINTDSITEYFKEEIKNAEDAAKHDSWNFGEDSDITKRDKARAGHYKKVVEYIGGKKEEPQEEEKLQPLNNMGVEAQPEKTERQPQQLTEEPEREKKPLVKYYPINENTARTAKELNSFSSYKSGEATEEYKYYVDEASELANAQIEKYPEEEEKILYYLDKYAAKLANWYNDYYRNEASCPSILVSGGSNFPTRKKEKQNNRRDTLQVEREYIDGLLKKIKGIGAAGIKAGDENAIEKLERKIAELEADHKRKMAINNYYNKNKTLEGCDLMTAEEIKETTDFITRFPFYAPCQTVNDTANIRRYKERLESLKKAKSTEYKEEENEYFKVVRNTELMRIQLLFDGKPSEEIRNILKSNGFRWAPSQSAWQRNLNNNGEFAVKRVMESLNKITA